MTTQPLTIDRHAAIVARELGQRIGTARAVARQFGRDSSDQIDELTAAAHGVGVAFMLEDCRFDMARYNATTDRIAREREAKITADYAHQSAAVREDTSLAATYADLSDPFMG